MNNNIPVRGHCAQILSVLILIFCICFVPNTAHAQSIQVYIFAGQSNMLGRGLTSELAEELRAEQDSLYSYVLSSANGAYRAESDGLENLRPSAFYNTFGPEVTYGDMADPDLLIKYAYGGTSLFADWNPDAPAIGLQIYPAFISHVQGVLSALDDYVIAGMFWQQGEADAGNLNNANAYGSRLQSFIQSVRTDLNSPDMGFYIGGLSAEASPAFTSELRLEQMSVAVADPDTYFIETTGLEMQSDYLHFDSLGQMQLGYRYADALRRSLYPSDRNMDGFVGLDDLDEVLTHWGQPTTPDSLADVNGDGFVGLDDIDVILGNWNNQSGAVAVTPEPSTLAGAVPLLLFFLEHRRR